MTDTQYVRELVDELADLRTENQRLRDEVSHLLYKAAVAANERNYPAEDAKTTGKTAWEHAQERGDTY